MRLKAASSANGTNRQPFTFSTAISGTTEIPIPAETIAKIEENWPVSNTTFNFVRDLWHADTTDSLKQ